MTKNVATGLQPVQGHGDHVHDCEPHQAHDHHPGISYGTALLGQSRVAHVDVALDCQSQGQPVGGGLEDLRSGFQGKLKQEAREMAPIYGGMATKCEGIDIPGEQNDNPKETEINNLTKVQAG